MAPRADYTTLIEPRRLGAKRHQLRTEQNAIFVMIERRTGTLLLETVIGLALMRPKVLNWLNHKASLNDAELEPRTRAVSTHLLQDYLILEQVSLSLAVVMPNCCARTK